MEIEWKKGGWCEVTECNQTTVKKVIQFLKKKKLDCGGKYTLDLILQHYYSTVFSRLFKTVFKSSTKFFLIALHLVGKTVWKKTVEY